MNGGTEDWNGVSILGATVQAPAPLAVKGVVDTLIHDQEFMNS